MRTSKLKKTIFFGLMLGALTTGVVLPIFLFKNDKNAQDEQNKKDVENIIKILEEKNKDNKKIILPSDTEGKIIADNQEKIIEKLKTLIGKTNLKDVLIQISMENDKDISFNLEQIQIQLSKGNYSKTFGFAKPYFVKREQNEQEIIADIKSVKTALINLGTKNLEVLADENDKSINANKDAILNTLKQVSGYSKIVFKDVEIKVKDDSNSLPSSEESPINITLTLSKGNVTPIEVTGFKAKQLDSEEVSQIKNQLRLIKIALENWSPKTVEVYAPTPDKTITHNKAIIKSAIENLSGYNLINFSGATWEVKDSDDILPGNDEEAINIILVLFKNNIKSEVQGFSAKLTVSNLDKVNKIISKIRVKEVLIAPNVLTTNQSEIETAVKNQLQKQNIELTNEDLSKISFNLPTLTLGIKTNVILNIRVESESLTLEISVEKINLLKNSNVVYGQFGTIFQDEFKNLWAMGYGSKLQVLEASSSRKGYTNLGWDDDNSNSATGLLKGSKITNGQDGIIFQDKFKNLWAISDGSKLQVLKVNQSGNGYVNTGWTSDNSQNGEVLLKGCKIIKAKNPKIFQDEFKNLWLLSHNVRYDNDQGESQVSEPKLQVLKVNQSGDDYVNTGWTNDNSETGEPLLKGKDGLNVSEGDLQTIFQDKFKNLWLLTGNNAYINPKIFTIYVLRANQNGDDYVNTGWTNDNSETGEPLLKGSKIISGETGKFFQDFFGNLWIISRSSDLKNFQVLEVNDQNDGYRETGWTKDYDVEGLLKNSNVGDQFTGIIFQDKFKNLFVKGINLKPQVLKVNSSENGYINNWTTVEADSKMLKNWNPPSVTNLNDVVNIFQDEFGNLWAIRQLVKIQVLKINKNDDDYVNTGWTNDNSETGEPLLKGLNIGNGNNVTIFQDEFKNLWVMGNQRFQVLSVNENGDGYVSSWI